MGTCRLPKGERSQRRREVSEVSVRLCDERRKVHPIESELLDIRECGEMDQCPGIGDRRRKPRITVTLHDLETFNERKYSHLRVV